MLAEVVGQREVGCHTPQATAHGCLFLPAEPPYVPFDIELEATIFFYMAPY